MRVRVALVALAAAAVAGCSFSSASNGTARVWVTRDRGAEVLVAKRVPAGLTAMQALDRVADVKTRYGGRFVQAIDGIEGSLTAQRDWFYFVNGYEADRSAAEYKLRPGDVEWWDYRSWAERISEPVVAGAFPEPFLHGYAGKRRPAAVRFAGPRFAGIARRLSRLIAADSVARDGRAVAAGGNVLRVVAGTCLRARFRGPETGPGAPVEVTMGAAAARQVTRFRFRYAVGRCA